MKNNRKTWKVIEILKTTTEFFTSKQIENPRLNAEQLLAAVLDITRVQLYVQFERMLTGNETSEYRELIRRRAGNEPLQYILGKTEFMELHFKVTPAALIPRPETEILIEKVIDSVNLLKLKNPSIIDIGTGSGCIGVSLAYYLKDSKISATDVSKEALELAKSNALLNATDNINFIHHDVLKADQLPVKNVDIVVSNPPYVSINEMNDLPEEIKNFEPKIALTDYDSGLQFYEKILSLIDKDLKCKFVFMEMNANLKQQIVNLTNIYNFKYVEVIPDLNNLPRILKIEI